MTALKPLENRRVRAVKAENYTLNKFCASPVSDPKTPADDPHHCFPRSAIGGDSWFVEITTDRGELGDVADIIPHVVGLSRAQHERVEQHEAWIKLEDGVWNWYERHDCAVSLGCGCDNCRRPEWELIGPLNPQPGQLDAKPRKARFKGEAKRARKTISIRIPEGYDADAYDMKLEQMQEIVSRELGLEEPYPFICIDAAFQHFIETYGVEKI